MALYGFICMGSSFIQMKLFCAIFVSYLKTQVYYLIDINFQWLCNISCYGYIIVYVHSLMLKFHPICPIRPIHVYKHERNEHLRCKSLGSLLAAVVYIFNVACMCKGIILGENSILRTPGTCCHIVLWKKCMNQLPVQQ